jgi:hypothetical protein
VIIPQALEDAMSRQARVILGESEMQIADSFAEASQAYINNPTALHLRAMNMLFEGLKEKGAVFGRRRIPVMPTFPCGQTRDRPLQRGGYDEPGRFERAGRAGRDCTRKYS